MERLLPMPASETRRLSTLKIQSQARVSIEPANAASCRPMLLLDFSITKVIGLHHDRFSRASATADCHDRARGQRTEKLPCTPSTGTGHPWVISCLGVGMANGGLFYAVTLPGRVFQMGSS